LNLGLSSPREDAGFLWLKMDVPSGNPAQPTLLTLPYNRPNVEVITNISGTILQVKVPQGLVNVHVITAYEYHLECFYDANVTSKVGGLYGTNAPAFVTFVVLNPDGGSGSNRLWITEQRESGQRQFQYTYTPSTLRWDSLLPDGQTVSTWRVGDGGNSSITNYYKQVSVGGQIVAKDQKTYQFVPLLNNAILLQEIEGEGTLTRTNTYSYLTNEWDNVVLQQVIYGEGDWVYYTHDWRGRIQNEYSAYNNSPLPPAGGPNPQGDNCRLTQYSYATDDPYDPTFNVVYRTVVSIPLQSGQDWIWHEVSRSYHTVYPEIGFDLVQQCVNPDGYDGDPSNLSTLTYTHVTYDFQHGLPYYVQHSDATTTSYTYPDQYTTIESSSDGTETTTVVDELGNIVSRTTLDASVTLAAETYIRTNASGEYFDPLRRGYDMVDLGGRTNRYRYNECCGYDYTVNAEGQTNRFDYDTLKRQVARTLFYGGSTGIKTTNVLDGLGRVVVAKRIGTEGSVITLEQSLYDVLGRLTRQTNALGGVTTITNRIVNNRLCVTNAYPDGGTRVETYYRDGRLESVTGTAVNPVRYEYGIEDVDAGGGELWREYKKEIKLDASGTGTSEWTKAYSDGAGRAYKTAYADGAYAQSYFNDYGQLWKQRDPDGVWTLHYFNYYTGEREYTIVPVESPYGIYGVNDYADVPYYWFYPDYHFTTADRMTRTVRTVVGAAGGKPDLVRVETFIWDDGQTSGTLVSTSETATSGLKNWRLVPGQNQATVTETVYGTGGSRAVITTQPDGTQTLQTNSYGRLITVMHKNSSGGQLQRTDYQYDGHGRQYRVVDARNGTTHFSLNNADQVTTVITPSPDDFLPAQVITTAYDNMGRSVRITQPDSTSVTNDYFATGLLKWTYGSRTYPLQYAYDAQGRMTSMKTYTNFSGNPNSPGNAAETTWHYDSQRGWLVKKVYDGETDSTADYTYTAGGRLKTRVWERGITTTYKYGFDDSTADNQHGDLTLVDYSDATPDVTQTYDRRGRLKTVTRNSITTSRTYNDANLMLAETYSGGSLNNLSVERTYYSGANTHALKLEKVRAKNGSTAQVEAYYSYDTGARMSQVRDNLDTSFTTDYGYVTDSALIGNVTFKQSTTPRLTTTKNYDYLNRLRSISSVASGETLPLSYSYTYNNANQRTGMTLVDGSYWVYDYDALGQVKSGKRYWSDGTPVAGQQFEYGHDTIGNRTSTLAGGDENGANLRSASYSANSKNQYTSRGVPAYIEVLGIAKVDATVTVEGSSSGVYRRGEYFRKELNVNNASAAQYPTIDVDTDVTSPVSGEKFLPLHPESFSHDTDGNLTQDGRWDYVWDGENRLVKLRSRSGSPATERRVEFEYDWQGRRIRQTVWNDRDDGQGSEVSDTLYLFDGWNLIAELNANSSNVKVRTYIWGLDLSGTMQGAGGVGGLLMVIDHTGTTKRHYAAYDGNGNVMGLADSTTGKWSARYEYGPFGEPIRASGDLAYANPMRWSTKYTDGESGLVYYGFRSYNPSTGRWLSRDPIEEKGGLNIYGFVQNNPVSHRDHLGKASDPNEGRFDYGGTSVSVTPSLKSGDPCWGGPLEFNVHIWANDGGARDFLLGAVFQYNGANVNYTNLEGPDEHGGTGFDVPFSKSLPVCPRGKQKGSDYFAGLYVQLKIEAGLFISFDWEYKCDCQCKLVKPLTVKYTFTPLGVLNWDLSK